MTKNTETNKRESEIANFNVELFAEDILFELGEDFTLPNTFGPRFKVIILKLLALHASDGGLDDLFGGMRADASRWITGAILDRKRL